MRAVADQVQPDEPSPPAPPSIPGPTFYVGPIFAAVFAVRLLGSGWNTHFPAVWPDATFPKEGYLAVAHMGPFDPGFYFAFRPIGYPLFLWILGRSTHLTVIAQTALYCAAVATLCTTAARALRSRGVAALAIGSIVGISVQAKYAMWSTEILSESLTISLALLAVAVWWRFAIEPTRRRAIWGWIFIIAWSQVRDTNVITAALVIVPVTLGVAWIARNMDTRVRRALAVGAVAMIVATCYSYIGQDVSRRASLQFQDLVGLRILPDAKLSSWFVAHGMPLDDAVRERTGKAGFDDTFFRSKEPRYARYLRWSRQSGRREYVYSLFALGPHYRDLFYNDLPSILKADMSYYDRHAVYDHLPRELPAQLGGPTTRKGLTSWLILAGTALAVITAAGRRRTQHLRLAVFAAGAVIAALVALFISWFGEPLEIERHAIGAVNQLSVALVIVIATAVDMIVTRRRDSSQPVETGVSGADEKIPIGV
jgi:hypothetical protein